tara:strand:+ start:200 stop:634 length:435 start_codon:yes stop_codon:yes gene_type:complete
MLILEPTAGDKTITIAPRSSYYNTFEARVVGDAGGFEYSDCITLFSSRNYSIRLRRDGDGVEETLTGVYVTGVTNYTQIRFLPTILQEDSTYYIEITNEGNLFYRDKVYATSQTPSEISVSKHEIGNGTIYKPYSEVDDNTYII